MDRQKSSEVQPGAWSGHSGDERMARLAHELNAPVSLIAGSLANLDHCLASIRSYIAATTGHRESDPDLERVYRQQDVEGELAAASDLLAICREGVGRIGYLSDSFGVSAKNKGAESLRGEVDLAAVIRRAVTFASATRGVAAAIELDLEQTPALDGDFEALSAAFINLVVNALDAVSVNPNPVVHLSLRHDTARDAVEVRVRDNGPGIDEESKARIFEAFYTTKGFGSGLGLAIVREALDRHGGSIQVGSSAGAGAEFIVRLPLPSKSGAPDESAGVVG